MPLLNLYDPHDPHDPYHHPLGGWQNSFTDRSKDKFSDGDEKLVNACVKKIKSIVRDTRDESQKAQAEYELMEMIGEYFCSSEYHLQNLLTGCLDKLDQEKDHEALNNVAIDLLPLADDYVYASTLNKNLVQAADTDLQTALQEYQHRFHAVNADEIIRRINFVRNILARKDGQPVIEVSDSEKDRITRVLSEIESSQLAANSRLRLGF